MKLLAALTMLVALAPLPLRPAGSQDFEYTRWDNGIGHSSWDFGLEKGEAEKVIRLWDSIGEDLKTGPNELAGTYVKAGYDSGYFLRWSTGRGYVLVPYFDQNLITDYSYGKVAVVGDAEVVFTPERELRGERSIAKMPRKWTAIGRHFVPVEMLDDYGDYMAGLKEYNEFNGACCVFVPIFLARRIDGRGEKFEHPVPPKYARFIKRPVEAEITSVGKKKTVKGWGYNGQLYGQWMERAALIPVTINAGRAHGVKRHMLFRLIGDPGSGARYLHVTRVRQRAASGYVVRDISGGPKETYTDHETNQEKPLPPIRVGARVTTSPVLD